jgi:hypothetical protein
MNMKLTGIIYLRDIGAVRMTGSALRDLDLFVKLCGQNNLMSVALVTTKWDCVDQATAISRGSEP